tara:strand:- start:737 stop:913 length:177 start_codon:yes stop_codon:yes gene_type:complete
MTKNLIKQKAFYQEFLKLGMIFDNESKNIESPADFLYIFNGEKLYNALGGANCYNWVI